MLLLSPLLLFSLTAAQPAPYTNLPPPSSPGLFTARTRTLISNTSVPAAWTALTDLRAYASWNPFVRAALVVSPLNATLQEQVPAEGRNLFLRTQIPPLDLPVSERSAESVLATQYAYERITHVQRELGRLCWVYVADGLVEAERWQAVSDMGGGVVLYESREVFGGALAGVVKAGFGMDLQRGFEAQGEGLKMLLEGRS